MVRKQTWILLVIFAVLLGVTFYLQKNPLPENTANATPSATAAPAILSGWQEQDITGIELKAGQNTLAQLTRDAQGDWQYGPGKTQVEAGKVAQITAQLIDTHAVTTLPTDYALDTIGLNTPAYNLILSSASQNKQTEVHIGGKTPTSSGYYVQVDKNAPVVVDQTVVDGLIGQLQSVLPTTAPEVTPVTESPSAAATAALQSTATNSQPTATP